MLIGFGSAAIIQDADLVSLSFRGSIGQKLCDEDGATEHCELDIPIAATIHTQGKKIDGCFLVHISLSEHHTFQLSVADVLTMNRYVLALRKTNPVSRNPVADKSVALSTGNVQDVKDMCKADGNSLMIDYLYFYSKHREKKQLAINERDKMLAQINAEFDRKAAELHSQYLADVNQLETQETCKICYDDISTISNLISTSIKPMRAFGLPSVPYSITKSQGAELSLGQAAYNIIVGSGTLSLLRNPLPIKYSSLLSFRLASGFAHLNDLK